MITPAKLRYFIAVVDCGSLSAATAELGVSQPTLSQQLSALEVYLGHRLLLRSATGIVVTEAGRAFYRHARTMLLQVERAETEVRTLGESGSDRVSLGLATCGAASTLALPLLRRLRQDHPSLSLRLYDNFAGTLSELIMAGRLDLALAYTAAPLAGVERRDLFTEELVVVAPAGMRLTREGAVVSLLSLHGLPAVLPSPVHFLRTVVDRACSRAGSEPRTVAEIDSLAELLEVVGCGVGLTILPRTALGGLPPDGRGRLLVHRIGPEPLEVTMSLCSSAQLPVTGSIELVRGLLGELVEERLAARFWAGVRRLRARPQA